MKIDCRTALGAVIILAAITGPALASPAVVISDTAVHEGPGTSFAPVWSLGAGTHVNVQQCTDELWCLIERRGKQGWLPASSLDLYPGVDHGAGDSPGGSGGQQQSASVGGKFEQVGKPGTGGGQIGFAPKPVFEGGGSGKPADAAAGQAQLADQTNPADYGASENTNQAHGSGPTFSTISSDITTIGDAVVAASCPRCR